MCVCSFQFLPYLVNSALVFKRSASDLNKADGDSHNEPDYYRNDVSSEPIKKKTLLHE